MKKPIVSGIVYDLTLNQDRSLSEDQRHIKIFKEEYEIMSKTQLADLILVYKFYNSKS